VAGWWWLQVDVLRGGRFLSVPSTELVPGEVIAVVPGTLPCDCVLLTGECIVDENMLTGELTGDSERDTPQPARTAALQQMIGATGRRSACMLSRWQDGASVLIDCGCLPASSVALAVSRYPFQSLTRSHWLLQRGLVINVLLSGVVTGECVCVCV
jgi:magnesium-transporting ATPase (P-type)